MNEIEVRLLGPLEVLDHNSQPVPLGPHKRQGVFAALASEANRVVPVDRLLEIVWAGSRPPNARVALQGHVSFLRKLLHGHTGLRLLTRPPGYSLQTDPGAVDADRLETLAARAAGADDEEAVALLTEAVDLWRGSPLAGLTGAAFEQIATSLTERYLTVLQALSDRSLRLGRADRLGVLQTAVHDEPLREGLVRVLMLMLYEQHRQADALDLYHRTRRALTEELGVDPGPELRAAYQLILAGRPAGPAAPPGPPQRAAQPDIEAAQPGRGPRPAQLPRRPAALAGRRGELDWLSRHGGPGSIVVLTGGAGTGKTSLALEWAHELAADHPDGQIFLDLRGYDGSDGVPASRALASALRSLGVASAQIPEGTDERQALFHSVLAERRVLLMLDNARSADQVEPLAHPGPQCTVLVTSRHRLDRILASAGARLLEVPTLPQSESVALLERLLGADRTGDDPSAVKDLVRLCAGLPLALRICAARLAVHPTWPIGALVDELVDEYQRLANLTTSDNSLSVAAALSTTQRTLDRPTNELFALLGLYRSTAIDTHAAAALAGASPEDARRRLAALADAHLVTEATPGQFTWHDLIRLHTRDLAAELPAAVRERGQRDLVAYFVAAAAAAHDQISMIRSSGDGVPRAVLDRLPPFPDSQHALSWFRTCEATITDVVALAADIGMGREACEIADHCAAMFWRTGNIRTWLAVADRALQEARKTGDAEAEMIAQFRRGGALACLDRYPDAEKELLSALEKVGPDTPLQWRFLLYEQMASVCSQLGDIERSIGYHQQSLGLGDSLGVDVRCHIHNEIAWQALTQQDTALAAEHAATARALSDQSGVLEQRKHVLHTQGSVLERLGDLGPAGSAFEEGLRIATDLGDDRCRAHCLEGLATVQYRQGDLAPAQEMLAAALQIWRRLGGTEGDVVAQRLARWKADGAEPADRSLPRVAG